MECKLTHVAGYGYCWPQQTDRRHTCPGRFGARVYGMTYFFPFPFSNTHITHSQTFGFATEEFQVTADRLGVYLPVVRCNPDYLLVPY
jgi:hypothetical protein